MIREQSLRAWKIFEFQLAHWVNNSWILLALGNWKIQLEDSLPQSAIAHGASEERKLLAREETVLVPEKQTGVFEPWSLPEEFVLQILKMVLSSPYQQTQQRMTMVSDKSYQLQQGNVPGKKIIKSFTLICTLFLTKFPIYVWNKSTCQRSGWANNVLHYRYIIWFTWMALLFRPCFLVGSGYCQVWSSQSWCDSETNLRFQSKTYLIKRHTDMPWKT